MFPYNIWKNPKWCLYNNLSGNIILKHPWRKGINILCPHCGKTLIFENYKAQCCDHNFGISFGEVHQKEPVGKHNSNKRGWASIRPYKP
jgi:hypothetical protein